MILISLISNLLLFSWNKIWNYVFQMITHFQSRHFIVDLLIVSCTLPPYRYSTKYFIFGELFEPIYVTSSINSSWSRNSYSSNSIDCGIRLSSKYSLSLKGFIDSDWEDCPTTRRSTIGHVTMLGDSPISWKSKKQPTVSRYFAEAENLAMTNLASKLQWLHHLFSNLGLLHTKPIPLYYDNQTAIYISENSVFYKMTKHIEFDY